MLGLLWASVELASADEFYVQASYDNYWFSPGPPSGPFQNYLTNSFSTKAGTVTFGGNVLGDTDEQTKSPTGGGFSLVYSAFGQPIPGVVPDAAIGDVITPPANAIVTSPPANFVPVNWEETTAVYYESTDPPGGAFWVPSTGQVIAAQPNNITIEWVVLENNKQQTNRMVYNIGSVPARRPARLFWTEKPYYAPAIDMNGLFPVIHYNSQIHASNELGGVWLENHQLKAKNVTGMFLIEYYKTGAYRDRVEPVAIEVVQVLAPQVMLVPAEVGSRLMPVDTYWANLDQVNGVIPQVTKGQPDKVYVHSQFGPKQNWAYAIKRTYTEPWSLEIYWQNRGLMDVLWPYEKDWYACRWPKLPQLLVLGDSADDQAPVLIPPNLTAEVQEEMEPQYCAALDGRKFRTTAPGFSLIKYATEDDVWFEVVQTVANTNFLYFDLEPQEWPIGEELLPGPQQAHALGFDGRTNYVSFAKSLLSEQSNWTLSFWFKLGDLRPQMLYSEANIGCTFYVRASTNLQIASYNPVQMSSAVTWANPPITTNHWHYLTICYSGGADKAGTVRVYLDDHVWETNGLGWVKTGGHGFGVLGAYAWSPQPLAPFLYGKIDNFRVWTNALTADQVRLARTDVPPETRDSLVLNCGFNEGQGVLVMNGAGEPHGTIQGSPYWGYGKVRPTGELPEYPGYLHLTRGDRYNASRYAYPTEADPSTNSYVFAVNTGELEVWWANRSRQPNMPPVYYPSRVVRYTNTWPDHAPEIVIASEKGNAGDTYLPARDALALDGTPSSCAVVDSQPAFNMSAGAVEAWVKVADPGPAQWVASRNGQYYLGVAGGVAQASLQMQNGPYKLNGGVVPANTWTHIAFSFSPFGFGRLYVNGERVAEVEPGALVSEPAQDLYIGRNPTGGNNFSGAVGEVRIWSRALSDAEMAAGWATRLRGDELGLLAYYPVVRGNDSSVLTDAGRYGLHGRVLDAEWTTPGRPVLSSGPALLAEPSIYYQNDPGAPGYNPNEEHSLVREGVAYALRNDLNVITGDALRDTSEAYTLVDGLDVATGRPKMQVFKVVRENELYNFHRAQEAGTVIQPLMPVGAMRWCTGNFSDAGDLPPTFKDRKNVWWASSGGNDGGTTNVVMRFFYPMQADFYFPRLSAEEQPLPGTELPWMPPEPENDARTLGRPMPVTYTLSWPGQVPEMDLGQTLTKAVNGLPEIWGQLSVEVVYQQAESRGSGAKSVTLFDPVHERTISLANDVVDALMDAQLARRDPTSPMVRFPTLPPSLYPRLYYDPNRDGQRKGRLVLAGQRLETLTGGGYLLLNLLEAFEKQEATAIAKDLQDQTLKDLWAAAIRDLPDTVEKIGSDTPYVKAALGADLLNSGYVTVVFNNNKDPLQVPAALPVSMEILRVGTNLYTGELEVIRPADVLSEQLSVRHSADLAGKVSQCDFRWKYAQPEGGQVPNYDFEGSSKWIPYGQDSAAGRNEVFIAGASPFTLADYYFAVQYRPQGGTQWSDWIHQLAPGWVKRVMTGVNPFLQSLPDMTANPVDTRLTMISQAGAPYQGDVALNMDSVSQAGLIPVYETVFNRAMDFSLRTTNQSVATINETLLFAASRLHDLYMLLGNEAYADAQDPTIAFPQELSQDTHGGAATSIFPFMNQVPNLLEEELALLRGRDDTLSPNPTNCAPVYNRLVWNFTSGISGGEPAYAYNYDIRGNPSNTVGTITVEDAKSLYPQGHGDAWGHYLSAIYHYYDLLAYTNFYWQTEPSATLLGTSTTVSTDFFDEQKFAETAAARARTGAEIVKRTFREQYAEDPGPAATYTDPNTSRAWGLSEWASRAGQAALYDWAVANSLMWDTLTNLTQVDRTAGEPEGIQKIDRASTPELAEITANLREIQAQIDHANGGLNPLGLAPNVVPFDIDPTGIDAGLTHFEQIYDRALKAVYNACVVFDQSRGAGQALRQQFESIYDLQESLAQNETDYHNRLIQLYGYPYSDDIGPTGTYPEGYDGPDLINWRILDLENLVANPPTNSAVLTNYVYHLEFLPSTGFEGKTYEDYKELEGERLADPVGSLVYVAENGLQIKSKSWRGRRRAQGELQLAMSDFVEHWYGLEAKMRAYDQLMADLEVQIAHRQSDYARYPHEWEAHEQNVIREKSTADTLYTLKSYKQLLDLTAESVKSGGEATAEILPKITAGWAGLGPVAEQSMELSKPIVASLVIAYYASLISSHVLEDQANSAETEQTKWDADLEALLKGNEYRDLLQWSTAETQVKLKEQAVKQAELLAEAEALSASSECVQKLVAEGDRLIFERAQVRSRAAQRIQMARYGDLSFRIFRDDALRRYQQAFDLASRYTYLAAKAYDYETGLLQSDTTRTPGSQFLESVVRARAPGRFYTWLGTPMVGGSVGEPGLADILARMKADWDVLKSRFGFNNPESETSRFSLRTELFRIAPDSSGEDEWMEVLMQSKVDDLNQLTEFRRYCRPFTDTTNAEPGLVIPFSTCVIAGQNYFGRNLAGGDNAYDASHAATKVRSMGVWFKNYDITYNTNAAGPGLANQPRVYLIPVGEDVLRSPSRNAPRLRHWKVMDQAIPLPYDIGGAQVDNPDWQPVIDSLREPFAQIRRFASFRAYHDGGEFDPAEASTNGRLVGRSVWNTRWLLIIPGRALLSDPVEGIERFIHGALVDGNRQSSTAVSDIKLFFQTYSISGD